MTAEWIEIRGARQNNLADVDVTIPRDKLVAVTGVSGSGKSSLAFDTLFREGQRRFLETLSAYARQFLGRMEKPDVDHVEGLSPAIAVDQKAVSRGPRSTVGTITEVVDHLRVLFARAGKPHCPDHGHPLEGRTPESVLGSVLESFAGQKLHVLAPLIRDRKGEHRALFADLARKGYVRVRVDGELQRIEEVGTLARYKRHKIELVVDRLKATAANRDRLREAVDQALEEGKGDLIVMGERSEQGYSTLRTCPTCGLEFPHLEPRLFSFNSPHGACSSCEGMGVLRQPSAKLVVTDASLSIREGCLGVTRASGGALVFPRVSFEFLDLVAEAHDFDLDTPWKELSRSGRRIILHGSGEQRFTDQASWNGARYQGSYRFQRRYRGVLPSLEGAHKKGQRKKYVARFLDTEACPECAGSRLNPFANAVTVGGTRWHDLVGAPIRDLPARLDQLDLDARETRIAEGLLTEIHRRLGFLTEVGLEYLTLDRAADTLSSGEAQRIRLAAQLGAGLEGVLYVLDEPSIGLHARDHARLFRALEKLRDAGNSVVVVEHDEATLRQADWLIDVGPGPGRHGGRIVASGPPEEVRNAQSPTGALLRGELAMPVPDQRREAIGTLEVCGARGFNLIGLDVGFPLGTFTVVSGVSGSGKSTLVHHTLQRALARHLGREAPAPEDFDGLRGVEQIEELVFIDSTPIGRTPRSNPATYSGAFTPIRDLFSNLPEAKMRGWAPGRFSFNVEGGRCEACQGAGARFVELQFLAPVTVACEECGGHRFQHETLEVRYRGKSIADVLDLTIDESAELFQDHPKIARALNALVEVGLGYLQLGQPSTTLSGGEAQRVKLAKHLQKRSRKHTLYLLDEPTTGLHQADVQKLVGALQALVDLGNTVIVIEHNLDVIRSADHVIDLGPEGGEGGGKLVVAGTPEEVEVHRTSYTGEAMRKERRLARRKKAPARRSRTVPPRRKEIVVEGARTHNLRSIDVSMPREGLTVITGPSGSGKSSLALDTIHALGRQRFVESLSTYARQFLASRDRPPVERISGLGPSVAVEARTAMGHPRSTIATTTEIHDHMRVLWARAGVRHCPEHKEKLVRSDAGRVATQIIKAFADKGRVSGWIVAPVFGPGREEPENLKAAFAAAVETWRSSGFVRCLIDGVEERLEPLPKLGKTARQIDLVVDRLSFVEEARSRVAEAVEQAEAIAGGRVSVVERKKQQAGERHEYSTRGACTACGFQLAEELEPRHFSFNTHAGACPDCDGLGNRWQCDADELVDHPERPLIATDGGPTAIGGKLGRYLTKGKGYYEYLLRQVAEQHRVDLTRPFEKLPAKARELVLYGTGARSTYQVKIVKEGRRFELEESFSADWPGLCGHVDAWHAKAEDPEWRGILERFMRRTTCSSCQGERLAPAPRAVTLGRKRLPEILSLAVEDVHAWLGGLRLGASVKEAVQPVLDEVRGRIELLVKVGLGYLTLDRTTSTLSGGEARRVRLSASLGSQLVGVVYVLDEPTVGLHPRDIDRLTDALLELRDGGNTVLVVEHDESVMRRADWIVDMGPGAGRLGGEVVVAGTPATVEQHASSLTAQALRGEIRLERPASPERTDTPRVLLNGARGHNLKGVSFEFGFGQLQGICGPSGSGKSTLILDTLVPALRDEKPEGRWRSLRKAGAHLGRVIVVDASPIGRTPASIPATAVGLMEGLRELFARTPDARMRGFTGANFSFNSTKGRCLACEGRGATKVEMQFLADLWLACEECDGKRYRPEVLQVHYRNRSIADVLAMSVDEAAEFLSEIPRLSRILEALLAVGLGYLALNQSSTTLSAGEAQRVKLASELLSAVDEARNVFVLDEPTTGLHKSDVALLYTALRRLTTRGHAVLVIEHHLELLAACDRLTELGPDGGQAGGRVIATGTPEELVLRPDSITGPWLKPLLAPGKKRAAARKTTTRRGQKKAGKKAAKKAAKKAGKQTGKKARVAS